MDDRSRQFEDDVAEAEADAAMRRAERARASMPAREFVSERDALEDAWRGSSASEGREEGW